MGDLKGAPTVHLNLPLQSFSLYLTFESGIAASGDICFTVTIFLIKIWEHFFLFYKGIVIYNSLCPKKGIKVDGWGPSSEPFLLPNQCSWPVSVLDLCEELNQEAGLKCLIVSLPPWTYLDIFTFSTT